MGCGIIFPPDFDLEAVDPSIDEDEDCDIDDPINNYDSASSDEELDTEPQYKPGQEKGFMVDVSKMLSVSQEYYCCCFSPNRIYVKCQTCFFFPLE